MMDSLPAAVIFDMDGVLVDSNPFHVQKWKELLDARGVRFDAEALPKQILGERNDTVFRLFFGGISSAESGELSEDLEAKFRAAFRPHAQPLAGLTHFMAECHGAGLPMAVASSAMRKNVDFVVQALGFARHFRATVSGDEVRRPKPDPEIYLAAAHKLGVEPAACAAFEDSFPGIEAVKRAGMKCVGIASTFPLEELRETRADLVVRSFEGLSLGRLRRLFAKGRGG